MYARLRCVGNLPLCLAFGTGNRLLRYGRDIRCQKQAPVVRDASSKAHRTAPAARGAFSEACRAKSSTCRSGRIFSARHSPRSEVSRHKKRVYSLEMS